LLILFAIIYIIGINIFFCLGLIVSLGIALFMCVYKLSHTYGQYGLMKKIAKKAVPRVIKSYSILRLKKQLTREKSV
jgi:hypothetical protein